MKISLNKVILAIAFLASVVSCSKKGGGVTPDPLPVVPPTGDTAIAPAIDPATANSIGFFLDDWQPKTFTAPAFTETPIAVAATTTVTFNASDIITKIPQSQFGHNAVWWMGPVAGNANFITPVTNLKPNILRFPGGSSSDAYFWNGVPGTRPADVPEQIFNAAGVPTDPGYNYGKTTYNWQSSLDDYYIMLQQTNSKGLITVNYGYARYGTSADPVAAAAHLAADWVRYDNGRTKYWEVGNENFGDWEWGYRINKAVNKDGQPEFLTGQLYAQHFKIFADSMKKAATEVGNTIYIGAVTYEAPANESWQTTTLKTWNSGMLPELNNRADYYVVHSYFTPYNTNSTATDILGYAKTVPTSIMTYLGQTFNSNSVAMKPIAMDEWNMFATGSKQQVSNVSGLFSVIVLGENLKNKFGASVRWDLLNDWANGDDHGLFSSGNEPGIDKWSPRPSFYYLYYFQKLLGDRMVSNTILGNTAVTAYSSTYSSGQANVTLVNTSATAQVVEVKTKNFRLGNRFYWYSFQGGTDNGEFSRKVIINGATSAKDAGGPADYATLKAFSAPTTGGIKVTVPARGSVMLVIDKK